MECMPESRTQWIVASLGLVAVAALVAWAVVLVLSRPAQRALGATPVKPQTTQVIPTTTEEVIRSGPTWSGDFEQGNLAQWSEIDAVPERIRPVRDPVRAGAWAARFEIRPGDVVSHGQRAELAYASGESEGVESWWGWSVYFPTDFVPGRWTVFTQWHDSPAGHYAPPVLFEVVNGSLMLLVRGGVPPSKPTVWKLGNVGVDQWYDFVFHVRWAADDTGFVELWLNDKRVVQKTQLATIYHGKPNYLKVGNYRYPAGTPSVLYIDEVKRGVRKEDVES
jgi:hypothetical protein